MITELASTDFERARGVFAALDRTAIAALIDGTSAGRIFVDDAAQPTAAFVWNEYRYCYLAGDADHAEFVADLCDLLHNDLFPAARDSHDPTVVLYPDSPRWAQHLAALTGEHDPLPAPRRTFTFDAARFQASTHGRTVPAGLTLCALDADLVARYAADLDMLSLLWRSPETFLAHGFGYVLLDGDTLASVCLAAFVAGGRAEIDIFTHPDYRGHGLATCVARAFIAESLTRHLTPVWECWNTNQPSIRLAEALGFQAAGDHTTYFTDLTRVRQLHEETNVD